MGISHRINVNVAEYDVSTAKMDQRADARLEVALLRKDEEGFMS